MRLLLWCFVLSITLSIHADLRTYVRAAAGAERAEEVHLRDRDCANVVPPALFGCGAGIDGRPLGAYGDFGHVALSEFAAGVELGRARLELSVAHRDLDLDADANFLRVAGAQPVNADGRSMTAMLGAAYDIGPSAWRVRPFVTAAAGAAHNTTGDVVYSFPGIAADAVTITRGGTNDSFAWSAGAGVSVRLSSSLSLDLTYRHTDLGAIRSPAGVATIVRPGRVLAIEVDETRAEVETRGVVMAIRARL